MQTCGTLYRALAEKALNSDVLDEIAPDIPYGTFALGFIGGQAEKTYSGACVAFMIRPGTDWWSWAIVAMHLVCDHYGLVVYQDDPHQELWGCADTGIVHQVHAIAVSKENTMRWHTMRACLCGIPQDRIDTAYHTREHFNERCEP